MPKYVVRFGTMRHLGVMNSRGSDPYRRGAQVIARTNRGLEVGEVLCEATEEVVSRMEEPGGGQILRSMSGDDFNELGRMGQSRGERFEKCETHVKALELDMQIVEIEQIFGGERIVVYYLAEQRVDFRELVKLLAADFQTRIEMRQIGVRDEAKLLADYGDCGKPVCCNTHLSKMPPVSMKMAKIQKATLDPNKISGRCGRLKCCLRYEYDTYQELQKEFPSIGSEVVTREGKGRVIGHELLAEQVLLETEDHRRMLIHHREILTVISKGSGRGNRKSGSGSSRGSGSKGASSRDSSSKDSSSKGSAPKDAASKDASSKSTTSRESASKGNRAKGAASSDSSSTEDASKVAANKDAANKDPANEGAVNKEAVNKEAVNKEAVNKDAANKDAANQEAASKDAASKDAANKDVASKDASSKNSPSN